MSYGLKLFNNAGDIVVDENYANFGNAESGSISGGAGLQTLNYAGSYATPPLIFISSAGLAAFYGHIKSGSNYVGCKLFLQAGYTFSYYLAVSAVAAASGSHGLRVYTPAGALAFDANRDYLKIKDAVSYSPPTSAAGSTVVTHASGISDPHYCINNVVGCVLAGIDSPPPRTLVHYLSARKIASNQAEVLWAQVTTLAGSIGSTEVLLPTPQKLIVGSLTP